MSSQIQDQFTRADNLLFKEKKYTEAERIYRHIIFQ